MTIQFSGVRLCRSAVRQVIDLPSVMLDFFGGAAAKETLSQ
jgi:hypothetical protein